jgi:hypothetical protein
MYMARKITYKMGKLPRKVDKRTLQLVKFLVLKNLPSLPDSYDVDSEWTNMIDTNMYGNDTLGDCVIAGRAHMTLRFEDFEQNLLIPITDQDVENEYFKETGGPDSGLNMLDSLNEWRQSGWQAAGEQYDIHAYAQIDITNHDELKYCIYLLRGAYTGFNVPQSAMDQFNAGQSWTVVAGSPIIGGHCVFIVGYNISGPICVTWGKKQQMTWDFWNTYFDEAYGIVQDRATFCNPATDPVDCAAMDAELAEITSSPPNPNPPPPIPSPCVYGRTIAKIMNFFPWVLHRKGRFAYFNFPKKEKAKKSKCDNDGN